MKPSEFLSFISSSIPLTIDHELIEILDHEKAVDYIEPSTIAAIASTTIKIMEYINSKESDSSGYIVAELKGEIDHAIALLNRIIEILIELKVFIQEEFRNFVAFTLKATLQIIIDSHDSWSEGIANENTRQLTQDTVNTYYNKLQQDARLAFNYGYAHYESIAFAYICESYLSEMLLIGKSKRLNDANRYRSYFDLANNPIIGGSLAYIKKGIIDEISSLKNSTPEGTFHTDTYEVEEGAYIKTYHCYLMVSGNVYSGFTYSGEDRLIKQRRTERVGDHRMKEIENYDNNRIIKTRFYNSAFNKVRTELTPNLKAINIAIKNCGDYFSKINEFIIKNS